MRYSTVHPTAANEKRKRTATMTILNSYPPPLPPPPPPPPPPPRIPQSNLSSSTSSNSHPAAAAEVSPVTVSSSDWSNYSNEPYGEVQRSEYVSSGQSSGVLHRRTAEAVSGHNFDFTSSESYASVPSSGYKHPPPSVFSASSSSDGPRRFHAPEGECYYLHNMSSSFFLSISVLSIFWSHESSVIPQVFLFLVLVLYALDLINARDTLAVAIWIGALILAITSGFAALLQVDDAEASGGVMIFFLLRLSVEGVLFCALACWCSLQLRWLHKDASTFALNMEQSLHSLIPPVSASILTNHLVSILMSYWGADWVATFAPILFALVMTGGMFTIGCSNNSFGPSLSSFSIPSFSSRLHSMLLLMVPGLMHVLTFRKRILSRNAGLDDFYDLVLVWSVPYLLHCMLLAVSTHSPYEMPTSILFPKFGHATLHGTIIPMIVSAMASSAMQNRYMIPICHAISYQFNGHDMAGHWVTSLYLTLSTGFTLFALWTWGRKSTISDELLFGEYHEDVVQLSLSASGLFLGKSFGIPWSLTPLPILAFLGLSVWVTTRMLRYLCLFLFVVHAGGAVLFNYRFAAIDLRIPLALPGFEVGLTRFAMLSVGSSVLVGLVAGFVVRPAGGLGAPILKVIDVPGILFVIYTLFLNGLELTLLKIPVPQDLAGKDMYAGIESGDRAFLYDHLLGLITALLQIGVAAFSQRSRLMSTRAVVSVCCIAIGKVITIFADMQEARNKPTSGFRFQYGHTSQHMFRNSIYAAILFVVIFAPRATLTPVHIKSTSRYKRSITDGKTVASIPTSATRVIFMYSAVILPGIISIAMPKILSPLFAGISSHFGGGVYYSRSPPLSEMFGFGLSLWGISNLSFLTYYLPDGGAETWKKISALTLLMGLLIACSAPPVPQWAAYDDGFGISNPYASVSSLGLHLAKQGRSRSGGWGVLLAFLATILAVSGPLELRERRHHSGRKDKHLLVRLMLFSILFGSGASWFVTMQLIGDASFAVVFFVSLSCIAISFFGTVACVLGYFLELENFDEVDQMAKLWIGSFVVGLFISGTTSFLSAQDDSIRAFGAGGWLSTYLTVGCLLTFALSVVLQMRTTKNQASRGLGNVSCMTSFLLGIVVLYGRFGVSGLDESFNVTTLWGIPASVAGTFILSALLYLLDTEVPAEHRSRVSRLSGGSKVTRNTLGFQFGALSPSNRLAFPILGSVSVLYSSALYTVFFRGFWKTASMGPVDVFSDFIGQGGDSLTAMVGRSIIHTQSLVVAARLSGCGIWTADSIFSPMIHICGLIVIIPSIQHLLSFLWSGSRTPKSQLLVTFPLNLIPLLLCSPLGFRAVSLIGLAGGFYQLVSTQKGDRRLRMRI